MSNWAIAGGSPQTRTRARRHGNQGVSNANASGATAASYSRYSSHLQSEDSIEDQQRLCRESANQNGHHLQSEFEFADLETSGALRDREGLDALLQAASEGQFQVLYFFSLSRLARESVISMLVLKNLAYNFKVRVISVSEGVDSALIGWDMMATMFSLQHEQFLKELSKNVRRGQEGAVGRGFSVGDYCFGYKGEPIPGSEVGRGRNAKLRMAYAIDSERAPWVKRIFDWYVVDHQSIRWITAELNHLNAPKDHRSTKPLWHTIHVRRVLANLKYVGKWPWNRMCNVRDPLTGKIHQEMRDAKDVEKWTRDLPELRLIDDATFIAAGERLQKNKEALANHRDSEGKLQGSDSALHRNSPNTLLSGLFVCEKCRATFYVGGSNGRYLYCQTYLKKAACSCKTYLPIPLARKMVLDVVGQRILSNEAWFQHVLTSMKNAWEEAQRELPSELETIERLLAEKKRQIERLVNSIESGQADPDINERIALRRREHDDLVRRFQILNRKRYQTAKPPTEEFLREQLQKLDELLRRANTPAAALALKSLVGGAIVLEEIRNPNGRGGYFRGRFVFSTFALEQTVRSLDVEMSSAQHFNAAVNLPAARIEEQVVIEFRSPPKIDLLADQAKALADQGLHYADVSEQLGVRRSRMTMLIAHWHQSRGLEVPDGRARRQYLAPREMRYFEQIAPKTMELFDQGVLVRDMVKQLKAARKTLLKTLAYGLKLRGFESVNAQSPFDSLDFRERHAKPIEDNGPPKLADDDSPAENAA